MPAALLALAIGAFGIGTTEFVIMGLLPEVATDLEVSIPSAGLLISGYALGVVVGAPLLTAIGSKISRKTVLLSLMGVFIVGNLVSALAGTYGVLMTGRIIAALAHGAFFGVGSVVAASLVAEGEAGQRDRADVHRTDRGQRARRSRRYRARPAVRLAIHLLGGHRTGRDRAARASSAWFPSSAPAKVPGCAANWPSSAACRSGSRWR